MYGVIYLTLIPLLNYFLGHKDSYKLLFTLCVMLIADVLAVGIFNLASNDLLFFSTRALFDISLMGIIWVLKSCPIRKTILYTCCLLSLSTNIYLCIETGNVFLYRQWETINLILCEVMLIALTLPDRGMNVLLNIRNYIYGAIVAIGLILIGAVKYLSRENKALEQDIKQEENKNVILVKQNDDKKKLDTELVRVRKKADEVEHENIEKQVKRIRPSGTFGDKRLNGLRNKD